MFITLDSPLRRIPVQLETRQVLFLDAIRYCVEMIVGAYNRLAHTLLSLRGVPEMPPDAYPIVFLDAWSLVDVGNRLRLLIESTPGLKRTPHVTVILKALESLKELRNPIQHLNKVINDLATTSEGVWGWLTWYLVADGPDPEFEMWWMAAGSLAPAGFGSSPQLSTGVMAAAPIDRIELHAFGVTASLTDIANAVVTFLPHFEDSARNAYRDAGLDINNIRSADLCTRSQFR